MTFFPLNGPHPYSLAKLLTRLCKAFLIPNTLTLLLHFSINFFSFPWCSDTYHSFLPVFKENDIKITLYQAST